MPIPQAFVQLQFGPPPIADIGLLEERRDKRIADFMNVTVVIDLRGHIHFLRKTVRELEARVASLIRGAQVRIIERGGKLRRGIDFFAAIVRTFQGEVRVTQRAKEAAGGIAIHVLRYAVVLRSEEHTSELQSRQYLVCRL